MTEPVQQALQSLMLRAMMQARYSADNVGHFGLGSDAYLHFTSPIRRYPDLLVHRRLKAHLSAKRKGMNENEQEAITERLETLAAFASVVERKALDAERAIIAMYGTRLCSKHLGEEHEGTVTGVAEFGAFVRLDAHHVEGLCHVSTFGQYVDYDEVRLRLVARGSGDIIQLGDRVRVLIAGADMQRRQVTLKLLANLEDEPNDDDSAPKGSGRAFATGKDDDYAIDPEEEARLRREHYERMRQKRAGGAPQGPSAPAGGSRPLRRGPSDDVAPRRARGDAPPRTDGSRADKGRPGGPKSDTKGRPGGPKSGGPKSGGPKSRGGGGKVKGATSGKPKSGGPKSSGPKSRGPKAGGPKR